MRTPRPQLVLTAIAIAVAGVSCSDGGHPVAPRVTDLGIVAASAARNDAAAAARDGIADIDFGRTNTGTDYAPPEGHDRSFHSYDKIS